MPSLTLRLRQKVPNVSEAQAVGAFRAAIRRGSAEFRQLVRNDNRDIVFKGEERNKDDDAAAQ